MKKLVLLLVFSVTSAIAVAADNDTVLINWRDLSLTQADYEAAVRGIPERDRFAFQLSMKRITQMLNTLLLNRTLAAEARQMGLDKDPIIQREMTLAAERVLAGYRVAAVQKSLVPPDMAAAAEERYRIHPEEFREPDQVHASHVLIDTKRRSEEEAQKRAEEVRSKALAGADFAALAKEFSDDPSSEANKGDLGNFARGRMVKPFEDAAFALQKPGDVSAVIRSPFGFHVIKLHDKLPGRQKSFDEVKQGLVGQLQTQFVTTETNRYMENITTDKSIVLNTQAIDKLKKEKPPIPVVEDSKPGEKAAGGKKIDVK